MTANEIQNKDKEILRLKKKLEAIKQIVEMGVPDCPQDETEQNEK